jgi:DNA-binding XRE family transcriptional regulator
MEQLDGVPPDGPVGALLRAFRRRACLSQEQLAARAELSERTVRNLEGGRVRSPHNDTLRLLAAALGLDGRERESWFAAARGANGRQEEPVIVAVLCLHLDEPGSSPWHPGCLVLVCGPHPFGGQAGRAGLPQITLDTLTPAG